MYSDGVILLSSITTIAAAVVAILWFLFGRSENNRGIPIPIVTNNSATASASSSTATAGVYEVFLSFCGEDTRKGFTDFLYTYLVGASIRTFRDDNELIVGEEIGPELLKAINESKISIPVLSKSYASSKWCLIELAQMVECHNNGGGQMIYPIFYDVDPSDVRNQTGSYGKSFRQHEKKFDAKTVQSWRKALRMVGGLKGLELKKATNGREGELVKIVVEKVLLELKKNYTHVPKNLVGMDHHVENLKRLLQVDCIGVRIVGIHGMGGLGKTTIAKVTYNQLCQRFESHCFLDNVRENSKHRYGILDLQNQLISKIQNRGVQKFSDVYEGMSRIKDTVFERKVLIVLDDVDEISQVDMLMGNQSWLGAQCKIIITTRNIDVICAIERSCQIEGLNDVCTSYNPQYMGNHDSLKLFCKYAFMRDSPMEGYEHLSKEVVSIAAGLPLVLVVLGSTFFVVKGKDLWEEKLRRLRVIPHKEVLEKLRFSFDALEYEQKQIFLDVACLFIGFNVTIPSYMWDDCGFYPREGINVLISKSLITISDDSRLIMHDQLRDLGRQIVREEGVNEFGKRSRLWCKQDVIRILETSQGISSVAALHIPYDVPSEGPVLASSFHDVQNLRYLHMARQDLDGDFKHLLPNLRWFQYSCSGKFTPTNLQMKNLVILGLSGSKFTEEWEGWSQLKTGKKLKVLDLSYSRGLRVFPYLSMFASLEILKLEGCESLCRLDGLEQLKSLKYLDASYCYNLETLPSLSNLTNLVELHLGRCRKLVEIQGLEKLESLQVLEIRASMSLERLSDFSNLKKLKRFHAYGCSKLIEIKGLHKLSSLEHLDLTDCSSLRGEINVLRAPKIEVTNFLNLKKLKEIKNMEITSRDNLIKFQGLDSLKIKLEVWGVSMKSLPDLSCLKELERLVINNCDVIQNIGGLDSLENLVIRNCEKLIEIQGLDRLKSLKVLEILYSPSLEILPDLQNFGTLKEIVLSRNKLDEIKGLGVIESLERLVISRCYKLREIPNLRRLKNLKRLSICCQEELTGINGLEELKSLEWLDIIGCKSIESLVDFSNLEKLTHLDIAGCVKLTEIHRIEELQSLEWLDISGCESIEALPDFSNLKKLMRLDVSGCVKPTEIRGLEDLKSLRKLRVNGCEGLKNLPDLPNTSIDRNPTLYCTTNSDLQASLIHNLLARELGYQYVGL